MSAPAIETDTPEVIVTRSLVHALSEVDRLLRNELNRSRHITLSGIRRDLATGIAHLGSPSSTDPTNEMDGESRVA